MKDLSERERAIAAAAYLKGLAVGLATDRTKTWYRSIKNSTLGTHRAFQGIDDYLRDGRGFNPLVIYARTELAVELGLSHSHADACQLVHEALHPQTSALG